MATKHPVKARAFGGPGGGPTFGLACVLALTLVAACAPPPPPTAPEPVVTPPVMLPSAPPEIRREFRGVWVATVGNMDWPSRPGLSVDAMKAELLAIMDAAVQTHLNAVVLQVRPACDALYSSSIEPWSAVLSGTMGQAPAGGFDPLAFAVAAAHARGLELHAWFNPYRAGFVRSGWVPSEGHVARAHPEMVRRYGSYYWLDPGDPKVRAYTLSVIRDVVRRYDIDGVHLDDYFYPYLERDGGGRIIPFPDDDSYDAYRLAGGTLARADWRRENVNKLVQDIDGAVHALKPWVKFGISPFGLYRDGVPAPGLSAYDELFADSKKWLNNGWVDYFSPQLYWLSSSRQAYGPVLQWWVSENEHQRHIWPGNFTSMVGRGDGWSVDELVHQIELTRAQRGADGNIHFSAAILRGSSPLLSALQDLYAAPALVPASPWLGARRPAAPLLELVDGPAGDASLRITPGDATPVRFWTIRYYDGTDWYTAIIDGAARRYALPQGLERPFWVVVAGVSRTGMEGAGATAVRR